MTDVPQPEDIYRRTKEEGARRLDRPLLEMISTALAAGFDIVAGITALAIVGASLSRTFILGNFFLAAAGNMLGGLGLVTLNRLTQGRVGERKRASA